jgi:hypothetical protein
VAKKAERDCGSADRAQAGLDVAQALAVGQLSESHAEELIETREASDSMIAVILSDTLPELVQGQEVHQLRENGFAKIHQPSPFSTKWKG